MARTARMKLTGEGTAYCHSPNCLGTAPAVIQTLAADGADLI